MELKALRLSKGASGRAVRGIDGLGFFSYMLNCLNLTLLSEIHSKKVLSKKDLSR
jgi:hypothetical protein